ncbi:polyphosphate kinase 2 family protein [Porphyromonas pogonae]|uniref:polyphosphate kinase 2 family protein n=1 Tax=Porphyromonas pogonae TaxID=867595 RepID=UPI002E769473|nr:polyphosphate kinase 2 family protein [Porphyromonas pogonae]
MGKQDLSISRLIHPKAGSKVNVAKLNTGYTGKIKTKEDGKRLLKENIEELQELQDELYASDKYSLLLIFQAMDAAGKDGTIAHVMTGVNPQGCQVFSFKQPSAEELDHDFMWRCYKALPERGRIGIFNRSYYEEVLITRVHPELILKQKLPGIDTAEDIDDKFFEHRYESINDMEKHLTRNGTIILKFFLNVSSETQKKRFLSRIDDPAKNWKFSAADIKERDFWSDYMKAYSDMITATNTEYAPWYIIPADHKWFMRLAVSNIIVNRLSELELKFPQLEQKDLDNLNSYRDILLNAKELLKDNEDIPQIEIN